MGDTLKTQPESSPPRKPWYSMITDIPVVKGLIDALRAGPDTRLQKSKEGAEAAAEALPDTLMPHAGIRTDRARKAMIDKQMAEGQQ